MEIAEGVFLYSCLSFEYDRNSFGLYIHGKVNSFIYSYFAITIVSSYNCSRYKLIKLARVCSRISIIEIFGVELNSIEDIMKIDCDVRGTLSDKIVSFSKANKCVVDIQCIITQWPW